MMDPKIQGMWIQIAGTVVLGFFVGWMVFGSCNETEGQKDLKAEESKIYDMVAIDSLDEADSRVVWTKVIISYPMEVHGTQVMVRAVLGLRDDGNVVWRKSDGM